MTAAESAVLSWCRKQAPGICMRNLSGPDAGKVGVVNVNGTEPDARYPGGRRTIRLATGDSWEEVADALRIEWRANHDQT